MNETQVWRYYEPNDGKTYEGWYVAFIDSYGFVSIQSDYGDYAYCWNGRGEGVGTREFLLRCDDSYLLGKFAPKREVRGDETLVEIKKFIVGMRRGGQSRWKKERAREEWDNLNGIDFDTPEGRHEWFMGTHIEEPWDLTVTGPSFQALAFMKHVWPRLMTKVRADIDEKKAANQRCLDQLEAARLAGAR